METYNISQELNNIRLDKAISILNKDLSRVAIQRLIEEGKLLVNGKKEKASYKVEINDVITLEIPEAKDIELKPQDIPVDFLYEDNDIVVVNKPKGMVVHPANGNPDGTLVNAIMSKCKGSLSGIGGEIRPGIVHRLDKDTSGVLVVAKNDKAHVNMSEQIKLRKVKKTYIALVRGQLQENDATINMPIARSTKDRKKMAVDKNGKEAITHFKVIERFKRLHTFRNYNRNRKNTSNKSTFIRNWISCCWRYGIFEWKKSIWSRRTNVTQQKLKI